MTDIERMAISEFVDEGYLQEVNRRFFHPLGLALEVIVNDSGKPIALGGVWDYRNDPEGLLFDEKMIDPHKARRVELIETTRRSGRFSRVGFWIQPVPEQEE